MVMTRLVVAAVVMAALSGQPPQTATPAGATQVTPQVRQRLVAWLPEAAAIGAKAIGEPAFYGENLFEYIDGGAEVYHQYQFAGLVHQKYRVAEVELTVDIYDMGSALNAFGIYSVERAPGYNYVPIGAEGYLNDLVLNFLQGRCYVKLLAAGKSARTSAVLDSVAKSISAKIGTGKSLPAELALFPAANRMPRSEKFIRTAPLGYDDLAPMFQADYRLSGTKVTLAISDAGNPREALARAGTFEKRFAKSGKIGSATDVAPGAFRGSSRYDGDVLWAPKGRYLALLIGAAAGGDDLFKSLLAKLPAR
jgi:Family of unknown function (DUF6599)